MSQQINLLLPELRPKVDWLGLPVVAAAAGCSLLLVVALSVLGAAQLGGLRQRDLALGGQAQSLQMQVKSLGEAVSARPVNAGLPEQIARVRLEVAQRQEVLQLIGQDGFERGAGYSGLMQGFGRQLVDGVWLVGFGFAKSGVEMRGRLLDPALLPRYIDKLNGEPSFADRRFAALDMKRLDAETTGGDAAANKPKVPGRFTEFALHSDVVPNQEKAR